MTREKIFEVLGGVAGRHVAAAVPEAPQEPESQQLPAFDGSKLTLKESYYDGEGLLLGVDLDAARQDPVVGYEPDGELLERLAQPSQTYGVYHSTAEDLEQLRQSIEENYQGTADYDALMAQLDRQQALLAAGDPDDLDVCLETGYISQEEYDDTMSRAHSGPRRRGCTMRAPSGWTPFWSEN